jgi:NAD(P)-dependent dehydrogenase (short-subunit alcohol dehydrogenase family)
MQVAALVARIDDEQQGRLDVLVNDVWGGDPLIDWEHRFWEHDLGNGLAAWRNALESHIVTAALAAPLLVARGTGLIVEITDGVEAGYRGSLFYDLAKDGGIRLARGMAHELRPHGIAVAAVSPGFLRSEAMLDHFGVTEETWRDAIDRDPHYAESETPHLVGRGIAALAADPDRMSKTGQALGSWHLMREYGLTDVDGRRPDWGAYFDRVVKPMTTEA